MELLEAINRRRTIPKLVPFDKPCLKLDSFRFLLFEPRLPGSGLTY
jgi:hypothetical protein